MEREGGKGKRRKGKVHIGKGEVALFPRKNSCFNFIIKLVYTLCFKKKFTLLLFAITKSDVDRFQ